MEFSVQQSTSNSPQRPNSAPSGGQMNNRRRSQRKRPGSVVSSQRQEQKEGQYGHGVAKKRLYETENIRQQIANQDEVETFSTREMIHRKPVEFQEAVLVGPGQPLPPRAVPPPFRIKLPEDDKVVWSQRRRTPFGEIKPCVHLLFNPEVIPREELTRSQHLQLLAAPREKPWQDLMSPDPTLYKFRRARPSWRFEAMTTPSKRYLRGCLRDNYCILSRPRVQKLVDVLQEEMHVSEKGTGTVLEFLEPEGNLLDRSSLKVVRPGLKDKAAALAAATALRFDALRRSPRLQRWAADVAQLLGEQIATWLHQPAIVERTGRLQALAAAALVRLRQLAGGGGDAGTAFLELLAERLALWVNGLLRRSASQQDMRVVAHLRRNRMLRSERPRELGAGFEDIAVRMPDGLWWYPKPLPPPTGPKVYPPIHRCIEDSVFNKEPQLPSEGSRPPKVPVSFPKQHSCVSGDQEPWEIQQPPRGVSAAEAYKKVYKKYPHMPAAKHDCLGVLSDSERKGGSIYSDSGKGYKPGTKGKSKKKRKGDGDEGWVTEGEDDGGGGGARGGKRAGGGRGKKGRGGGGSKRRHAGGSGGEARDKGLGGDGSGGEGLSGDQGGDGHGGEDREGGSPGGKGLGESKAGDGLDGKDRGGERGVDGKGRDGGRDGEDGGGGRDGKDRGKDQGGGGSGGEGSGGDRGGGARGEGGEVDAGGAGRGGDRGGDEGGGLADGSGAGGRRKSKIAAGKPVKKKGKSTRDKSRLGRDEARPSIEPYLEPLKFEQMQRERGEMRGREDPRWSQVLRPPPGMAGTSISEQPERLRALLTPQVGAPVATLSTTRATGPPPSETPASLTSLGVPTVPSTRGPLPSPALSSSALQSRVALEDDHAHPRALETESQPVPQADTTERTQAGALTAGAEGKGAEVQHAAAQSSLPSGDTLSSPETGASPSPSYEALGAATTTGLAPPAYPSHVVPITRAPEEVKACSILPPVIVPQDEDSDSSEAVEEKVVKEERDIIMSGPYKDQWEEYVYHIHVLGNNGVLEVDRIDEGHPIPNCTLREREEEKRGRSFYPNDYYDAPCCESLDTYYINKGEAYMDDSVYLDKEDSEFGVEGEEEVDWKQANTKTRYPNIPPCVFTTKPYVTSGAGGTSGTGDAGDIGGTGGVEASEAATVLSRLLASLPSALCAAAQAPVTELRKRLSGYIFSCMKRLIDDHPRIGPASQDIAGAVSDEVAAWVDSICMDAKRACGAGLQPDAANHQIAEAMEAFYRRWGAEKAPSDRSADSGAHASNSCVPLDLMQGMVVAG